MSDTLTTTTTEAAPREPFRAKESFLSLQMARGHAHRMRHELAGHWVLDASGIRSLVRTCCGGAA